MRQLLVCAMRARRPQVLRTWDTLLRRQHVVTPLANPDIFAHEMGATFDTVLAQWGRVRLAHVPTVATDPSWPPSCHCGRNPFLSYYVTGEEALVQTLTAVQAERRFNAARNAAELNALRYVVRRVGRVDIEGFEAFCQTCPHADRAGSGACRSGREPRRTERVAVV
jgi:hypothetical protein